MKKELTQRQQEILNFIYKFREENGYPPTLREIGKHFGITSTFGVKRHLEALVKKEYLSIESNASRGISFIDENELDKPALSIERNDGSVRIPVVGRVAAGAPILAEENLDGSILIDSSLIKRAEHSFALKVSGDSMINAGIFDGDLVIVSPQNEAVNGDIVVAMMNGEVTVKTFENRNNKVRLIPENENYLPIEVVNKEDFSLVGKVKGIIRLLN